MALETLKKQINIQRKIYENYNLLALCSMEFLPKLIQVYSERYTEPEPELLTKIYRDTHLNVLKPRMLSGHFQGRLLSMISQLIRPKRILEVGTYTGYSAICLAEGLHEEGKLVTLDKNDELEKSVRDYFEESGLSDKIDFRLGNAVELIPTLEEKWDLVFLDADKSNYLNYYKMIINQTKTGGLIIVDNVLWSGKVVDNSAKDADTLAIREFNEYVHDDPLVSNILMPIRDGLMMIRKL